MTLFQLFWALLSLSAKYGYFSGPSFFFLPVLTLCIHPPQHLQDKGLTLGHGLWVPSGCGCPSLLPCPSLFWFLVPLLLCVCGSLCLKWLYSPPPLSTAHQVSVYSSFKSHSRPHLLSLRVFPEWPPHTLPSWVGFLVLEPTSLSVSCWKQGLSLGHHCLRSTLPVSR